MLHALPPVGPPPAPIPKQYTECIISSAAYYQVPPSLITAILMVEGGRVGTVSGNTNDTADLGPMQINTIHLDKFESMGISRNELVNDACLNITAGTYILANRLAERPGQPWHGAANYHSKTPKYHKRYLDGLKDAYTHLLGAFASYVRYLRHKTSMRSAWLYRARTPYFRHWRRTQSTR